MSGREAIGREEAISRIAVEYIEMPDLMLTVQQASRLWNIPVAVATAALSSLAARGFLVVTRRGAYLRSASGPSLRQAS